MSTGSAWAVAAAVLLVNVPFGFWRAGTRKFTATWFLAVHAPVPVVAALRVWADLTWEPALLLLLAAAFFAGQVLGGRLRCRPQEEAERDAV